MSIPIFLNIQMSTYLVAWANGPYHFLESSYTSPLSGKARPMRFYGQSSVKFA